MSQPQDQSLALHDRWLAQLKAKRPVAVLLVATAMVGGLATWADAFKKIREAFVASAPKPSSPPSVAPSPPASVNPTPSVSSPARASSKASPSSQPVQTRPTASAPSKVDKPVIKIPPTVIPSSAPTQQVTTSTIPRPQPSVASNEERYRNALELAKQGQLDKSVQILNDLANEGHPRAQYQLGRASILGEGVPQSYSEAFRWFSLAAKAGLPPAQHNLAVLYQDGLGTSKDDNQALIWYAEAAKAGYSASQEHLRKLGRSW